MFFFLPWRFVFIYTIFSTLTKTRGKLLLFFFLFQTIFINWIIMNSTGNTWNQNTVHCGKFLNCFPNIIFYYFVLTFGLFHGKQHFIWQQTNKQTCTQNIHVNLTMKTIEKEKKKNRKKKNKLFSSIWKEWIKICYILLVSIFT